MTITETRTVNAAREADMREELRDRLDHMRAVADARGRVHALVEAAAELGWSHAAALYDAGGVKHWLTLDDLRVLLDAEFTPGRDTKQAQPERVDDDDEDETGVHRRHAAAQRGGPSPEEVLQHVLPIVPAGTARNLLTVLQGLTEDMDAESGGDTHINGHTVRFVRDVARQAQGQPAGYAHSKGTHPSPRGWDRV